ncbi:MULTISPECIES: hypothetical protein [Bacillus]|nr:hypothetical protein [Bacillus glycinifermentans]MBU8785114.1 hypothetical protein [Bacillus glycinifermentans]MED8019263.1 hypothetical protein [Bacillus glycinifermentans]WKB79558.1 hypothetical protein QYM22_12250 [Bacillus glycinifermentans]
MVKRRLFHEDDPGSNEDEYVGDYFSPDECHVVDHSGKYVNVTFYE